MLVAVATVSSTGSSLDFDDKLVEAEIVNYRTDSRVRRQVDSADGVESVVDVIDDAPPPQEIFDSSFEVFHDLKIEFDNAIFIFNYEKLHLINNIAKYYSAAYSADPSAGYSANPSTNYSANQHDDFQPQLHLHRIGTFSRHQHP
jgi:hypothetical protein